MSDEKSTQEELALTIDVGDEETALEVGLAISRRAYVLHEDPCDENDELAKTLRDISKPIIEEFEEREQYE